MRLKALALQQFRSYETASFEFTTPLTVVLGPNASGKSNFLEAVSLIATGKSFHAEHDTEMIRFGQEVGRVKASIVGTDDESTTLELVVASLAGRITKRFLVNDIPRRRVDFAGRLPAVLFLPSDLEIIVGSPGMRRRFLDSILEQTDRGYRIHLTAYEKALRRRNKLLEQAREAGHRDERLFSYWDELLVTHGQAITKARETFITFINTTQQTVIPVSLIYNASLMSVERLLQYKDAEIGAGVTLVGPHRDDFIVQMQHSETKQIERIKQFGSRGQQRLAVLQLKVLQIAYLEQETQGRPLLLLDDIFSELDAGHMRLLSEIIAGQQTIITTTHKEFLKSLTIATPQIIELM